MNVLCFWVMSFRVRMVLWGGASNWNLEVRTIIFFFYIYFPVLEYSGISMKGYNSQGTGISSKTLMYNGSRITVSFASHQYKVLFYFLLYLTPWKVTLLIY